MKQKYKKLAFFILLLSMLTGCMLLSGCMENTENGSQSSYIVDSDELQDTENQNGIRAGFYERFKTGGNVGKRRTGSDRAKSSDCRGRK